MFKICSQIILQKKNYLFYLEVTFCTQTVFAMVSAKSLVNIFLLAKVFQPTTVFIRNFQIFLDTYFAYSTLALTLFDDAIFISGGYCLALLYIFLKIFNRLTLLVKLLVPALIIKQSDFSLYKFSIPSTISLIVALRKFFYGDFL